jgi:predicted dehydrogenase
METILDPFAAPVLRWGVIGAGGIANTVVDCIRKATKQDLVAVAARSKERAQTFADKFAIPRAYGSYQEIVSDPEVDVVYIATVHNTHFPAAKLALEAGKNVLMEKAFTLNQSEAQQLADLAKAKGLFLMEAMWTRFLPHMVELRNRINAGDLGELRYAHVDFGFRDEYDPNTRFYDPKIGGGALLDRGIYSVSWAVNLLGIPDAISARATLAPTGVDAQVSAILDYTEKEAQALVESALNVTTPQDAWISGTKGSIRLPAPFWAPTRLEIQLAGSDPEVWSHPTQARGYEYEIAEVARCLSAGQTESKVMPVAETVAIMGVLDEIRAQCGVSFPGE